ncbi:MAG: GNAT family N-acetyltransferase [Gammaproteobacteria bacterium]
MMPDEPQTLELRQGSQADMPWLYQTFKRTMQEFIDGTWGWDELLQSHSFYENLPAKSFAIASVSRTDVAALNLREKTDHLWLEMVLVLPEHQGSGYGRQLLEHAQDLASHAQKPLRLSVLKLNPAQEFYRKMGFEDSSSDQWSHKMQWLAPVQVTR